jgi:hypothetical protein
MTIIATSFKVLFAYKRNIAVEILDDATLEFNPVTTAQIIYLAQDLSPEIFINKVRYRREKSYDILLPAVG